MTDKDDKPDVPEPLGPLTNDLDSWSADAGVTWGDLANDINTAPNYSPQTSPVTMRYVNSQATPPFDFDVNGVTRVRGNLIIEDLDGESIDVGEFIKSIGERLCVLQPNLEAHEHYPALQDAYEKYKMLEKLLVNNNVKKD